MAVKKSRYWNAGGEALDIETAGYALMAQIILGRTGYAGPIVTYLTNKRRGGVGFSSSQVRNNSQIKLILKVSLLFLACSVQLLISTFNRFLCVIRFHVSSESHSFWLLLLFPRTSSQDFARCVSVLSSDCLRLPPQIQGLSTYSLLSSWMFLLSLCSSGFGCCICSVVYMCDPGGP